MIQIQNITSSNSYYFTPMQQRNPKKCKPVMIYSPFSEQSPSLSTVSSIHDRVTNLKVETPKIPCADHSKIGSHLQAPKAVSRTIPDPNNWRAQKCPGNGRSWDIGAFNMSTELSAVFSAVEIEEERFEEMWAILGAEVKSVYLTMLLVTSR